MADPTPSRDEPTRSERQGTTTDPAASMSLLTQLLDNPLDAGYHAYSRVSHAAHVSWWRRMLILLLAVVLGIGCAVAVRNLTGATAGDTQDELLKQARLQMSGVQALDAEVAGLASQVRDATNGARGDGHRLDPGVAVAAAVTAVEGPGLTVSLDDRAASGLDSSATQGRVTDQDLRIVINALWSGGAEALTVNGLRIGPGTFVRTAGSVILVDITAVQAPYEVDAIGDAAALSVALVRGTTGDYLSAAQSVRGITVHTATSSSMTMDALVAPPVADTRTDSSGG